MNPDFSMIKTKKLQVGGKNYLYYPLEAINQFGYSLEKIPFSVRVLLEAAIRQRDGRTITDGHIRALSDWGNPDFRGVEIPFKPARIVLQDFTGVPAVVDLAAMRSCLQREGVDPAKINPLVPVDLVIDHSLIVDEYGNKDAFAANIRHEFRRNGERYRFLRWAQQSFDRFRVVPPGTGIIHQVNLEYLATLVRESGDDREGKLLYPDSLIGTDSHTTMINGLGIVGWGVGGIEAEACMLGQPLYFALPEVIGVKLTGELCAGVTATDLALEITSMLRAEGVVGRFVEFFGPGVATMSLPDRATIANMCPEYGATVGYFPFDRQSMEYLLLTGREPDHVDLIREYYQKQKLLYDAALPDPQYSQVLELDLGSVRSVIAGPKRPQDKIDLSRVHKQFAEDLVRPAGEGGFGQAETDKEVPLEIGGSTYKLRSGSLVLAAITSCTNTSNPSVMLGAGIMARKAVSYGLKCPAYVKTSLTPGSQVVTTYFAKTGLDKDLEELGFYLAGYGCCTCIGNSGPLPEPVAKAIDEGNLVATSVLSGNRNFEGRIHPQIKASYLASPILVVAYALAGRIDIDWENEPLGISRDGKQIYLRDIWPDKNEINAMAASCLSRDDFRKVYDNVFAGPDIWQSLDTPEGQLYSWNKESTYIQEPPFFDNFELKGKKLSAYEPFAGARVLALLGDSVTTDHISPAGAIAEDSSASEYLRENGIRQSDFNSYGSRRGNHNVMLRGTFANTRLRNYLVPGTEGGYTLKMPENEKTTIYDAAMRYERENTPLLIIAGKEYGTGSSRDWAAKGTSLLGVAAVIAESYERIHRSNLVGMGVLPLQFADNGNWRDLGITGSETYELADVPEPLNPGSRVTLIARFPDGTVQKIPLVIRLDNQTEIKYFLNGGILQTVLREIV